MERVYIYWNLHKNLYSVRHKGRIKQHANFFRLRNVKFSVSEKGRQRVLLEKQKNVHAGLRGEWCEGLRPIRGWRRVTYDPYRFDAFVTCQGLKPLIGAEEIVGIIVGDRAKIYARGLKFRLPMS